MRLKTSHSALSGVFALLFLLAAASGILAAPKILYAEIRFQPSKKASVYVRAQGNRLWVASTPDGLTKVKPITAVQKPDGYSRNTRDYQRYEFPETVLPVSIEGLSEVSAVFYTSVFTYAGEGPQSRRAPRTEAYISAQVHLTRKDSAGNRWTYVFRSGASAAAEKSVVKFPAFDLPQVDNLQLTIVTKIEGKKARIALQAKAGEMNIENVLKNGKNAACELKVVNDYGKVVVSEKGDLKKFGFT